MYTDWSGREQEDAESANMREQAPRPVEKPLPVLPLGHSVYRVHWFKNDRNHYYSALSAEAVAEMLRMSGWSRQHFELDRVEHPTRDELEQAYWSQVFRIV